MESPFSDQYFFRFVYLLRSFILASYPTRVRLLQYPKLADEALVQLFVCRIQRRRAVPSRPALFDGIALAFQIFVVVRPFGGLHAMQRHWECQVCVCPGSPARCLDTASPRFWLVCSHFAHSPDRAGRHPTPPQHSESVASRSLLRIWFQRAVGHVRIEKKHVGRSKRVFGVHGHVLIDPPLENVGMYHRPSVFGRHSSDAQFFARAHTIIATRARRTSIRWGQWGAKRVAKACRHNLFQYGFPQLVNV